MAIIDRKQYDVIVHPTAGQGDYTSIATALSTEGADKNIFVATGTYNESSDYNCVYGVSRGCDSANLSDGGNWQ